MLYTGYVGFSVAFAFSLAAMLEARVDGDWIRWSRRWTLFAWSFLTLGIALGSWWAYYELGWGGWWFWDPVENASFMPWLVGTALIHSQSVSEKRGGFRGWTLLLAIFAFSLSLLGTFLVRSGVLTSVHAFASDPARGLFILAFLGAVVGGALTLFATRAPRMAGTQAPFAPLSRETLVLLNNLLLATAAAMVLLGTLYPLLADAAGWGKISVGPPYFGTLFLILMAPLVVLVPFGPLSRWQRESASTLLRALRPALAAALVLGAGLWLVSQGMPMRAIAGVVGSVWVILGTLIYAFRQLRDPERRGRFGPERIGMTLAHLGIGVFALGTMLVEATGIEKDVRLKPGESTSLGAYSVRFDRTDHYEGPNFAADRGTFTLLKDERELATLQPEKRLYSGGGNIMTESAIAPGLSRDVYVAMGEPLGNDGAWAVRVYLKPFVRCIWLGAVMMMLGGLCAASERRLRARASERPAAAPADAQPA
jgi:cytochrome c-type biogenesis protein CcmF